MGLQLVLSRSSRQRAVRLLMLAALVAPLLAACGGGSGVPTIKRAAFSAKEFGVAVSPRVTNARNPAKGGGRYLVGKPYKVRGEVYTPEANPVGYVASGTASWYGADFHGRRTANGEIFSANAISGASPTLPLPSYVRVTSLDNGRSLVVRVNDRGPYLHGRVMDLSYRAAAILGYATKGVGNIQVAYIGPAPLNGDDTKMLLASVDTLTRMEQGSTRLAMTEAPDAGGNPIDGLLDLFGYTDPGVRDVAINGAHAAANAMATRAIGLGEWVAVVDEDARAIRLRLGVFIDAELGDRVASAFAMLGAVDEEPVSLKGRDATRLTLTRLKPGVARSDAIVLARELGLSDIVLY